MAATLHGVNRDRIAMTVLGYEFPDLDSSADDANWINLRLDMHVLGLQWSATSPCTTASGLFELAQSVDAVAYGVPREQADDWWNGDHDLQLFMPLTNESPRRLRWELRGRLVPASRARREMFPVPMQVTPEALHRFAAELRVQANRFPVRSGPLSPA